MRTAQLFCVGVAGLLIAGSARADLMVTAAGAADGFSISTFASSMPNNGSYGPMGTVTTSAGNILVTDYSAPATYSFNDVDGQTPASALAVSNAGVGNFGITNAGGQIYVADWSSGNINLLNNDGSFNSIFMALPGGVNGSGNGITTDPVNGHIYVDSGNGINDIDPVTKNVRHVNNVIGDGITVSPDGQTIYLAVGDNSIVGYNAATGAPTGFSVSIAGADGVGIIASGSVFNGYLVVNTNNGNVDLVDPTGATVTTIASGGSRGDFVGVDSNNGTLFLSQTSSIDRLACGPGCQFETSSVPEPASAAWLLFGLAGAAVTRIRKKV